MYRLQFESEHRLRAENVTLCRERFVQTYKIRVVTNTRKYDRGLHSVRRHELHWLDMTDRIQFRTAVTVYRCLRKSVPGYLANLCIPLSDRSSRYHLRFTAGRQLVVPPAKLSTYGHQAFTVSGPRIWNSLPDYLKDSELSIDIFKRYLKTYFPSLLTTRHFSALETP